MLPARGRQHRGCIIPQAVTQSSAPEDGRDHHAKHAELIGIINKALLLHLFCCLYYLQKFFPAVFQSSKRHRHSASLYFPVSSEVRSACSL